MGSLGSFYCSYFLPKKDAGSRAIHHPLLTMQNHEIFQKNPYSIVHFKVSIDYDPIPHHLELIL